MYFYDPKYNLVHCKIDESQVNIVAWSDRGIKNHIRVIRTGDLSHHFSLLPTNYSKLIYDPKRQNAWVQYEGQSGNTCRQLIKFIEGYDFKNSEEYIVSFKRFARNVNTFSLPKSLAYYEYQIMDGYGLSKAIGNVTTGQIMESTGPQSKKCEQYIKEILK